MEYVTLRQDGDDAASSPMEHLLKNCAETRAFDIRKGAILSVLC